MLNTMHNTTSNTRITMHSTMATILRHNPLTTSLQVAKHVLRKALEWCSQHKNDPAPTQVDDTDSRKKTTDIEEWDRKFMQVDHHEDILAANYMDIKALLNVDPARPLPESGAAHMGGPGSPAAAARRARPRPPAPRQPPR